MRNTTRFVLLTGATVGGGAAGGSARGGARLAVGADAELPAGAAGGRARPPLARLQPAAAAPPRLPAAAAGGLHGEDMRQSQLSHVFVVFVRMETSLPPYSST